MYGEEGFESKSQGRYQSWSYYHEDFGIYDDDPEIVTLDSADFQRSVLGKRSSCLLVETEYCNILLVIGT
jgi:hypothetical protein